MWYKFCNNSLKEVNSLMLNEIIDNIMLKKFYLKGIYNANESSPILFNKIKTQILYKIKQKYGDSAGLREFTSSGKLTPIIEPIIDEVFAKFQK